jgi:hypothetical protein
MFVFIVPFYSMTEIEKFNKSLQEYMTWNQRDIGPLMGNRARRLQWEIYRQFKADAPTREKIESEVASRGFRIRRRKRGDGLHRTVQQEIDARVRSRGWLALSFTTRGWKNRKDGETATYDAQSRYREKIGKAVVRTAKGEKAPKVQITSFLEGAVTHDAERQIVDRALAKETSDMAKYISRKQTEKMQKDLSRTISQIIK